MLRSYTQGHDRVDNIVIVLLESLDSLVPRHRRLSHNQLNVLGLQTAIVNLLPIILFLLLLLLLGALDGLALAMVVTGVVVAGMFVVASGVGGSKLLSSGGLSLGVQVLNFGLTEDTIK